MAACHLGDRFDLDPFEAEQLGVLDQVARVPVVAIAVDGVTDVVEEGGVLQELARGRREREGGSHGVEERERQAGHVATMRVRSREAGSERLDRSPAPCGCPTRVLAAQAGEVEEQAFTQGPRAGDERRGSGPREDEVEQHRRRRHQVDPLGINAGEPAPFGGVGSEDLWISTRASTSDVWGTPVNLGPSINSSAFDGAPPWKYSLCSSCLNRSRFLIVSGELISRTTNGFPFDVFPSSR